MAYCNTFCQKGWMNDIKQLHSQRNGWKRKAKHDDGMHHLPAPRGKKGSRYIYEPILSVRNTPKTFTDEAAAPQWCPPPLHCSLRGRDTGGRPGQGSPCSAARPPHGADQQQWGPAGWGLGRGAWRSRRRPPRTASHGAGSSCTSCAAMEEGT